MKKTSLTTLFCIGAIILFLTVLAVLPRFAQKRKFEVDTGAQKPSESISIDREFKVLGGEVGGRKKVSLRQLFKNSESRIILNLWATWCPPCIEELPSLEYLQRQLRSSREKNPPLLVALSVDEGEKAVQALFPTLDFKPSFIVLLDPNGEFAQSIGTTRFPETYLIDAKGKIDHKWLGPQDWLAADVVARLFP